MLSNCNQNQKIKQYDVPQKIIVAGKIDNYDPNHIVENLREQNRICSGTDIGKN